MKASLLSSFPLPTMAAAALQVTLAVGRQALMRMLKHELCHCCCVAAERCVECYPSMPSNVGKARKSRKPLKQFVVMLYISRPSLVTPVTAVSVPVESEGAESQNICFWGTYVRMSSRAPLLSRFGEINAGLASLTLMKFLVLVLFPLVGCLSLAPFTSPKSLSSRSTSGPTGKVDR